MITFNPSTLVNQELKSDVPKVFTFEGVSTQDLDITEVKVSCGCTTPFYPPKIKAGETFYVSLQIDLLATGYFSKSATITYSSGESSKLTVSGTVN
jgi:hypothetical protein